jgi:two-component system response regulator DesR
MEQTARGRPDLLLLDLTPEVTFGVLCELQHSPGEPKVVLWVSSISPELAFQAMGLGIRGILRRTLPAELQVKCLQRVAAGELWFEKALTDSVLRTRPAVLTRREDQIVGLLSQGMKNKEIGAALMISEGAVKVYLSRIFQKVGVKDRFELALFGLKRLGVAPFPGRSPQRAGGVVAPGLRGSAEKPPERPDAAALFPAAPLPEAM